MADTPAGKRFDVALLWAILLSVAAVLAESVESVRTAWGHELRVAEFVFTGLFTLEYILRLIAVIGGAEDGSIGDDVVVVAAVVVVA